MSIVIVSEKRWNNNLLKHLSTIFKEDDFILIDKKDDFTIEQLLAIDPHKVFIPHWSHIIPREIYENFECIVFHMTDLPYGRGGSPLQNLIVRGHKNTKISALRVDQGIDTGDIYLKKELSLEGTAEEIFMRANKIVLSMIADILQKDIYPTPQDGSIVNFKRRKPEQGNIGYLETIEQVYDYIRMLDAEGYPHAFINNDTFKFEFSRASLKADGSIVADVKIIKN